MAEPIAPYVRFRQFSTIFLAALTGMLILLPLGMSRSPNHLHWYALAGLALGGISGYRRRSSRFFFYFCLAAIIMLSCLMTLANRPG